MTPPSNDCSVGRMFLPLDPLDPFESFSSLQAATWEYWQPPPPFQVLLCCSEFHAVVMSCQGNHWSLNIASIVRGQAQFVPWLQVSVQCLEAKKQSGGEGVGSSFGTCYCNCT